MTSSLEDHDIFGIGDVEDKGPEIDPRTGAPKAGTILEDGTRVKRIDKDGDTRKDPIARASSIAQSRANEDDIFGLGLEETRPNISDTVPTMKEIRESIIGTNGLRMIGSFDGGGGSITGFAMAGWQELGSGEFVQAACETISANYHSRIITPSDVLACARKIAERDGYEFVSRASVGNKTESVVLFENDDRNIVVLNKARKVHGRPVSETIDWESTIDNATLNGRGAEIRKFRHDVCLAAHEMEPFDPTKTVIWGDDIRGQDPFAMMTYMGLKRGELDCFEGSPPCKSFSISGLGHKGWGRVLHYSEERDQRTDDLFFEYVRILDGLRPKSFVAENVYGMAIGRAGREVMAPLIKAFRSLGYSVEAKVLNSCDYGVPQSRPRVFFVGIRTDMIRSSGKQAYPEWPEPLPYKYTCGDVLEACLDSNPPEELAWADFRYKRRQSAKKSSKLAKSLLETDHNDPESADSEKEEERQLYETYHNWLALKPGDSPSNKAFQFIRCHPDLPVPTITQISAKNVPGAGPSHPYEPRKFTMVENRMIFSFPRDYALTGTLSQQGERLGRSVTPLMMKEIASCLANVLRDSKSDGSIDFDNLGDETHE